MKSIITLFAFLLLAQASLASETISCPVGFLKATNKEDENSMFENKRLVLKLSSEGSLEGEVKSENGMTILAMAYKDEFVDVYDLSLMLLGKDEERMTSDRMLLKYDGVAKGDGWDGEEGTDKLSIISGGLEPLPARIVLTYNAFTTLKEFGAQSRVMTNVYSLMEPMKKAIAAKKMKKGEVIGIGTLIICNRTK